MHPADNSKQSPTDDHLAVAAQPSTMAEATELGQVDPGAARSAVDRFMDGARSEFDHLVNPAPTLTQYDFWRLHQVAAEFRAALGDVVISPAAVQLQ